MDYGKDILLSTEVIIVIISVITVFLLFLGIFIKLYLPFKKERDYIKMEISRSFEQEDYLYWKKELKRFYMSRIPFVGRFFR